MSNSLLLSYAPYNIVNLQIKNKDCIVYHIECRYNIVGARCRDIFRNESEIVTGSIFLA